LYGGWENDSDMHTAALLFFSNGGSSAYFLRVPADDAVAAERTFNDRSSPTASETLTLYAKNLGAWGNSINISIANSVTAGAVDLTVYYGGISASNVVERFTDVTMEPASDRYLVSIVNAQSNYIIAVDENSAAEGATRLPVTGTNVSLTAGSDGVNTPTATEIATAVEAFDTINFSLVLNAPGITAAAAVNLLTTYAENRGDVFVVIDGANLPVTAAGSNNDIIDLVDSYSATSYGAVYYPRISIKDPTTTASGVVRTAAPGGAVVGLFMSTDASRGVFKAPAGLSARIGGAVSVPALTTSELDTLNSNAAAVNAIRFVPGSGIVVMGSRTLNATYVDKYVPVRRTLIYLRKSLSELSQFAVFEPNNEVLWRRIVATLEGSLTNFWRQGGLRGATPAQAFYVKCDAELNPQASIDNGIVNIEVGVALQRPAEFVIIKIGQFDGGTTVTVA
jgi:phage tail sheath protein FI